MSIMSNEKEQELAQKREIRVHTDEDPNIVSVPFGDKFLQGKVVEVGENHLKIDNYAKGVITIPKDKNVIKFFPGQKFDLRELQSDTIRNGQKTSIKESLNRFLKGTKIGNVDNLIKNSEHKRDLMALLSGKLSSLIKSQTIVEVKAKDEEGNYIRDEKGNLKGTGESELKEWAAKFYITRNKEGDLKLNTEFQRQHLDNNVYGIPLTEEQQKQLQMVVKDTDKNGNEYTFSPTIEGEGRRNDGERFKVFIKLDKELNKYITFPYDEKIAEKLQAKNERLGVIPKKEEIGQDQKQVQSQKQDTNNQKQTERERPKITPPKKNQNQGQSKGLKH